jgi:hypothetical protein
LKPPILPRKQRSKAGSIDRPAGADDLSLVIGTQCDRLLAARDKFDSLHRGWPENFRTQRPGLPENFFVQSGTIHLIRRDPCQVASADFAAIFDGASVLIGEPETHPLFQEMCLVQVLSEAEDAAEKIGADFHRRLTDPTSERGGLLNDEDPEVRSFAKKQDRTGRPGQRAADDDDIVGALILGGIAHGWPNSTGVNPPG